MSLNNIRLNPQLLAELYGHVLVERSATVMPVNETNPQPAIENIKHLGNNLKQVLVLVENTELPFLSDEDFTLLTSILTACQLSLADIALVNWHHVNPTNSEALLKVFNSKQVLLFGITPQQFGLAVDFPFFQVQPLAGRQYLCGPALSALQNNKEQKLQLWSSLKKMFSLP